MKKLLLSASLFAVVGVVAPAAAEAKSTPANSVETPQVRYQTWNNRRNRVRRGARVVATTRIVGYGRNRYRETVRITYLPNGRTITKVISRQRVGWRRG